MAKGQGKTAAPFSHSEHMQAMFDLYIRSGTGKALWMGTVGLEQLHAAYCAGFTEGVWTERAHPGMRKERGDGND